MEEGRHTKRTLFLAALGIFVTVAIAFTLLQTSRNTDGIQRIKYVPSILEESLQNETNTILDTLSGRSSKDSTKFEPGDL